MILSTHAIVGAAIGKNIESLWIIILLSLAVHYFLDGFRHGEYFDDRIASVKNTWRKISLDLFIGFFIIIYIIFLEKIDQHTVQNMFIGIFFSLFPDFITLMHWAFKKNKLLEKIKKFHAWAHRYSKFPKYSPERQWTLRNAANDILISAIAIIILFL